MKQRYLVALGVFIIICAIMTIQTSLGNLPSETSVVQEESEESPRQNKKKSIEIIPDPQFDSEPALLLAVVDETRQLYTVESVNYQVRQNFADQIDELLQYPDLPAGCEITSLTCVLNSMGFEVTMTEIADEYLEYGEDYLHQYVGSPYEYGGAFTPALVIAANNFLTAQGSEYRAYDLSGSSFDNLLDCVRVGYPVLIWTTMFMEEPLYTDIFIEDRQWYDNEHCVVLYGIDDEELLVNDPLQGLIRCDRAQFQYLYEACGSMALVIL